MTWTLADAYEVLAVAQSFDRRTVGDADAAAWMRAIGDLPIADAKQAIVDHYSTSTDWLMPGHVRAGVKRIRADRLDRSIDAVPDADPDNPTEYAAALRDGRVRVADGQLVTRDMRGITSTFPSPPAEPRSLALPRGPARTPLTHLPAVDPERLAQARAELDELRSREGSAT